MGREDVSKFLEKNRNTFWSAENIAECTGVSRMSVTAVLSKMVDAGEVIIKIKNPPQGPPKKFYCYLEKDDLMDEALHDFAQLRTVHAGFSGDIILSLCILRELKAVSELLKNKEEEKCQKKDVQSASK